MNLNLNLNKPMAMIGLILGVILGLSVLAAMLAPALLATAEISDAVENGTTGNAKADAIFHIFDWIVPLLIVLSLIGLIIAVASFKR